jgi:hypothetical protein
MDKVGAILLTLGILAFLIWWFNKDSDTDPERRGKS